MINRTFLDKSTTIISGSKDNFGLHPISRISYGNKLSRALVHFPIDKEWGLGGKHVLNFTNCASLVEKRFHEPPLLDSNTKRASSFDIIAFAIPQEWDEGVGFDESEDVWLIGDSSVSQDGANWYNAYNGMEWRKEGIYTTDELAKELLAYNNGEKSIIISRQHFDHGNENFKLDVTSYVEECIKGERKNYGICLAFSPIYEDMVPSLNQYVGFFSRNTRTFFEPVLESYYRNLIEDSRNCFYVNRKNKLYLILNVGGSPANYDKLPTCEIDGKMYEVHNPQKGVYYVEAKFGKECQRMIKYDLWSNLYYDGEELDDVEMSFICMANTTIQNTTSFNASKVVPSLSGINDNEKLNQGDKRIVNAYFRIPYESGYETVDKAYYRLYVKDGKDEYAVIEEDDINKLGLENYFVIDTAQLVPNEYHVDIITKIGLEKRIFKNKLVFTIVNDITHRKL